MAEKRTRCLVEKSLFCLCCFCGLCKHSRVSERNTKSGKLLLFYKIQHYIEQVLWNSSTDLLPIHSASTVMEYCEIFQDIKIFGTEKT
jgi:hypothetical protein